MSTLFSDRDVFSGGGSILPSLSSLPTLSRSRRRSRSTLPFDPSDLDPEQIAALQRELARASLTQEPKGGGGGISGFLGSALDRAVPDIASLALSQIATSLIYTPAGMYQLASGLGRDISDIARYGDTTPERTAGLGRAMGEQIVNDFRHPTENPGYLLLDIASLAPVVGLPARASRGLSAARAAGAGGKPPPLLPPGEPLPPAPRPVAPSAAPTPYAPRGPRRTRPTYERGPAPNWLPEHVTSRYNVELEKELRMLAREVEDPGSFLFRPTAADDIADSVAKRIIAEQPSQERFDQLMRSIAEQGSAKEAAMEARLTAALERNLPKPAPKPRTTLGPMPAPVRATPEAPPPVPEGQLALEGWQLEQNPIVPRPFSEQDLGAFTRESPVIPLSPLRDPFNRLTPEQYEQFRTAPGARGLSTEEEALLREVGQPSDMSMVQFASFIEDLRSGKLSPEELAELRRRGEGKPSGIADQRRAAANQLTASAREAETFASYLKEAGFKPEVVPRLTDDQVRKVERLYSARYSRPSRKTRLGSQYTAPGRFHIFAPDGEPTGVSVGVHKYMGEPDLHWMVYDAARGQGGKPISAPIKTKKDALRLAKMHAAERIPKERGGLGLPLEATSLRIGGPDPTLGTITPKGELVSMPEAVEIGRLRVVARDAEAKRLGLKRPMKRKAQEGEEPDAVMADEDVAALFGKQADEEGAAPSGVMSDEDVAGLFSPYRDKGLDGDAPIEDTPAVSPEGQQFVKDSAPEEIHDVLDEVFEDKPATSKQLAEEMDRLLPESKPVAGPRAFGVSDRQLGINPKALERAGLSREQGNKLRGPLRELYEGSNLRTPEEVQEVIRDTLGVSDEEAARIFNATRGESKATPSREVSPEDVQMVRGSLLDLFKKELDAAQAAEAAERWKGRVRPYMQQLKAEGRAPKKSELMDMLKAEFGEDLGPRLFSRLYRAAGGSGESQTRIFFREFFKSAPRERMILTQPVRTEETYTSGVRYRDPKASYKMKREVLTKESVLVDLSKNPVRQGFQRWYYGWLNQAEEGTRAARIRSRKIKFEKDEVQRLENYLERAGMSPEEIAALSSETNRNIGGYIDTMNQIAQIGVLYMKPAYIPPNLLGQILFTTIDHAWNPIAIARSFKLHKQLSEMPDGETLIALQRAGMGEGMYSGIAPAAGASKSVSSVHNWFARNYGKILDLPFRDASFINEAWRLGYDTPEKIATLVRSKPGSAHYDDMLSAYKNANRNIVDYGRLNPTEKRLIRRAIFFYPWIKGSTIWAGRAISEHPIQMGLMANLGRQGEEEAEAVLGKVPSYMRGIIPVGERDVPGLGKMPRIINPAAFSVTGSGGEFLNSLRAFFTGGTSSEQLSEYLTPGLTAAIAAATRTDPFTGKKFDQGESALDIASQELLQSMPFIRAAKNIPGVPEALQIEPGKEGLIEQGKLDPADTLLPTSRWEELARFATGLSPITYNVEEGQERAVAEDLELRQSGEGAVMRWNQKIKASQQAAREAGVQGDFPKYVMDALRGQARRDREYELLAAERNVSKSDLGQIYMLRADLGLLVRDGVYSEREAQLLLQQYAALSDNSISQFRRKLRESYFGTKALYAYRDLLRAQGVDETVLKGWEL